MARRLRIYLSRLTRLLALSLFALAPLAPAAVTDRVDIAPTKTSIYIGSVAMVMPPFERHGDRYESTYRAKVRPYFFASEHGTLAITVPAESLQRLARGEAIEFEGEAYRDDGAKRGIAGRAVPIDASSGRIKVRVFITKHLELVFHTTYRFVGELKSG